MPIKDVQVYVDNDSACETRIENAANLATQFKARLLGLYAMRKVTVPAGTSVAMAFYEAFDKESLEQCEIARNAFVGNSAVTSLDRDFLALNGYLTDDLAVQSRYADLLMIPQYQDVEANLNMHYRPGSILIESACPVLLLPDSSSISFPLQSALVAWNGSRECANALRAAWPMLERVRKIDVVAVSSNEEAAMNIALHIKRHGIEAETHMVDGSEQNAGEALLGQAELFGSQLLVMGAYGHSRLRELVLGGTTKHVLEYAQLPVLFSH